MSNPSIKILSGVIAKAILKDVISRRGWRQEWESCFKPSIRAEILKTHVEIIKGILDSSSKQDPSLDDGNVGLNPSESTKSCESCNHGVTSKICLGCSYYESYGNWKKKNEKV